MTVGAGGIFPQTTPSPSKLMRSAWSPKLELPAADHVRRLPGCREAPGSLFSFWVTPRGECPVMALQIVYLNATETMIFARCCAATCCV